MFIKSYVLNHIRNKKYHIYTGKDFMHMVNILVPEARPGIKTKIKEKKSILNMTDRIDTAINILLNSGKYNENKVLVIINPYHTAPLTALIAFQTAKPCGVTISGDDCICCAAYPETDRHIIPVCGLHAGSSNIVGLTIKHGAAVLSRFNITIHTGGIPDCISNNVSVVKHTDRSASPLTLIFGGSTRYPFAFDEKGEIRYYLKKKTKSYGLYPLLNGHFLLLSDNICVPTISNPHSAIMYEMDYMGHVYNEYLIPCGIHHDGCEMRPGGNILSLSSSLNNSIEDMIIEIDRENGKVIKKLCLGNILHNHPYMNIIDWAHLNTVSYHERDNCVLICARNIHSVIKINWETMQIKWIMCDPAVWENTPYRQLVLKPEGNTPYFYQAHAAYYLADNLDQIIVYDNHIAKRRPVDSFDNNPLSYVRIYNIDETNMAFSLCHEYSLKKSTIRSNAFVKNDRLFAMNGHHVDEDGSESGSVNEFDRLSGMLINQYSMKKSFYRGYSFPDNINIRLNDRTFCPEIKGTLPTVKKYEGDTAGLRNNAENPGDALGKLSIRIYNGLILIYCKDHMIQRVYYVGRHRSYIHDHSQTTQKKPKIFGNEHYYIINQTRDISPGCYTIYIESGGRLYNTSQTFRKK